jgi:PhoD-like phosphatase/O-methyltransferase domain
MLGDTQERWLYDGFKHARARWTVLGQQVMVMRNDRDPDPKVFAPSMDKWDGAVAARDCLFTAIEAAKVANVVALTGDVHQNWAGELKKDFADEKSATLGVEFVATSVASGGDGFDINDNFKALLQQDPHIKFFNSQRGYVRHVVTPNRWQADFQVLDKVSVPDGRVSTHKSFVVESGKSGLAEALVVLDCAPLNVRRVFQGIIDLAAMHRLPAMYHSFQPGREASADALAAEMARSAIRQAKLPFIESPDHDTLLDQVKQEIRDCDVFVCVPGSRPSFVESEVSMAFGLEKPLLFVLIEADTPRLPNTAKKGYPVFALERFQREGFGTLVNFCSYPAADWRSTVRLYGAVLAHIRACAKLAGAICLVSIVALTRVMGASAMPDLTDPGGSFLGWTQAFVSNRAILWIIATSLVLFLVPYGLFSMTRLVLRAKLRRVIAGKKFSDSFLPETLAYSLTRADLLKDGPKSYAELATAAGAHPGALYRLLRMLASVGMFAEVGHGHFTLIPLTTLLFDRPHVLEGAQRGVEAAGVGDRCEIVPRDFFTAVPAGGDVYILKWVLLDWEDEHALTILRNCHRVMQDQGKLLVVEMLIPPGNAPFAGKVIDLGILVSVPGRHRTEAEYRGLLSAAGFTLSRVIPTKSPRQVSILESLRA